MGRKYLFLNDPFFQIILISVLREAVNNSVQRVGVSQGKQLEVQKRKCTNKLSCFHKNKTKNAQIDNSHKQKYM